ncbi:MAG: class I SAM-dependent methyltransferase [Alphaproteobacteria bacterium]|nr:class I SAM-dependent methyltransferase [Alphaproteobacteria bacterium]
MCSSDLRNMLKNPHYFPIYERHLSRYVGHPVTVFEIGTGEGGSCQMWKYYFGPMCRIVTIDIADKKEFAESQIFVRTGSQDDAEFLGNIVAEFGPPDIVLDDGSHLMTHINASFRALFPAMSTNGTYLVEDLNTAYWADFGGGLRVGGSFIERCKLLIDEMNAEYTNGALAPSAEGRAICNISFYKGIVVLEKAPFINTLLLRRPIPLPDEK